MSEYIGSGLYNYYGEVEVKKDNDNYFMTLDNYDGERKVSVSEQFYNAFVKEFGEKNDESS